ncbi:Uncharacterised protein [Klebsiella aerogenes]|nr:Uncharacterised protein [Klebsiella aerogenes]
MLFQRDGVLGRTISGAGAVWFIMENLNDHPFGEGNRFAVYQIVGSADVAALINGRIVLGGNRNAGIGMGGVIRVRRAGPCRDRHCALFIIDNDLAKLVIALAAEIERHAFARQLARIVIILGQNIAVGFQ